MGYDNPPYEPQWRSIRLRHPNSHLAYSMPSLNTKESSLGAVCYSRWMAALYILFSLSLRLRCLEMVLTMSHNWQTVGGSHGSSWKPVATPREWPRVLASNRQCGNDLALLRQYLLGRHATVLYHGKHRPRPAGRQLTYTALCALATNLPLTPFNGFTISSFSPRNNTRVVPLLLAATSVVPRDNY
jgi:hypothetical protein